MLVRGEKRLNVQIAGKYRNPHPMRVAFLYLLSLGERFSTDRDRNATTGAPAMKCSVPSELSTLS